MSRTTRLLALMQALRRRSRAVTAAALATELEVSERTIYRDIASLAAQGAPISGEAGVGYVLRPGLFLPPLMLDRDETEALLLGLRYVEQRGDDTLARAAAEVRAKIGAVLPPHAREAIDSPSLMPGPTGRGFPPNMVGLDTLRTAIEGQRRLRIAYTDGSGSITERVIWPLALGFMNDARIVAAWCELRQDWRSFRTDRIASADVSDGRYPGRRTVLLDGWKQQMDPEFSPDKN
ncbi:YafY family protein [Emcibacter sp. SYSU 3D8]|uniref:helix-turn-helix transcriptional regulator n=1 Tax=Emcibacter sp. SYSU 3D8 TaxID=3133969 RepID=UPI0031FEF3CA